MVSQVHSWPGIGVNKINREAIYGFLNIASFTSCHLLSFVVIYCDRIAILDAGCWIERQSLVNGH